MVKITKEAALAYHEQGKPGKIEVVPTKPYRTQTDLSLAYSPGVAEPCLEIQQNPDDAYRYTNKGNLVAVISNGTAVLGLGDIGAVSGKPVMEGKSLLFKIYAGVDAFDIEVDEKDPERFIQAVKAIAPTFGGINLEDIKAPECFEIERRLKAELDIPVMHDDQHGTAIISCAGLLNALDVAGKRIEDVRVVINGAGAAAISCTRLYCAFGVKKENVVMLDSKGVIRADRTDLNAQKREFATTRTDITTLAEAVVGCDVFVGLSKGNVLSQEMVRTMADRPIIFALANPVPEITYEAAKEARPDVIMSTGRTDYPNQINNVIGFPYIFRGALDTAASAINEEMKMAAVRAIADLARRPVPDIVNRTYNVRQFTFGAEYIIPKPVDPRLVTEVSMAVAKAAMESGVARRPITDWKAYRQQLRQLMGQESKFSQNLIDTARTAPQRVVFAEGTHPNVLEGAIRAKGEGICHPILLGNVAAITALAAERNLSLEGVEVVDLREPQHLDTRNRYAQLFASRMQRGGYTLREAIDKMYERNYFGMMMVEAGDADALITGMYTKYSNTIKVAKEIIGVRAPYQHFATMHLLNTKKGILMIADTLINRNPTKEALKDITLLAASSARFFNRTPAIAMISYSNFGTDKEGSAALTAEVVKELQAEHPDLLVDGEMQVNFALDREARDEQYPFTRLKGVDVNTLVFPNLSAANSAYKMIKSLCDDGEVIGPIQMGLNKPIHFTDFDASPRDIVNIVAVAVIDALVQARKSE